MKTALVIKPNSGMGAALIDELISRSIETNALVSRLGKTKKARWNTEGAIAKEGSKYDAQAIAALAQGVDIIFYPLHMTYDEKPRWRESLEAVLGGARLAEAKAVIINGHYRLMERGAERHLEERLASHPQALLIRLPELYGWAARNTVLHHTFRQIAKGKRGEWLGRMDVPTEYVYLPDAARTVVESALEEQAYNGRIKQLTGVGRITGHELAHLLKRYGGDGAALRQWSGWRVKMLAMFDDRAKALAELAGNMRYSAPEEADVEVICPDGATRYEDGVRETLSRILMSS